MLQSLADEVNIPSPSLSYCMTLSKILIVYNATTQKNVVTYFPMTTMLLTKEQTEKCVNFILFNSVANSIYLVLRNHLAF